MSGTDRAPSIADRSFLLALEGWGGAADPELWQRFEPGWRETLNAAWEGSARRSQAEALESLRREHAAQVQPDLAHVHPSWWFRGLQEETPSIRRAAVASAPARWRETLRRGLGLSEEELAPDLAPQPEVLQWVAALWPERLVGDVVERADDPLVVSPLTGFAPRAALRAVRTFGTAKWAASRAAPPPGLSPRGRARFQSLREALGTATSRLPDLADRDVAAVRGRPRHALARLGSVTVARLLSLADPYRIRWVLQHTPYTIAKQVRSLMPAKTGASPAWAAWETRVFCAARDRLEVEGLWPRESEVAA